MSNENTKRQWQAAASRTVARVLTVAALSASAMAIAQGASVTVPPDNRLAIASVSELERAFWMCDYVATTRGMDATPIAACTAATDRLKHVKFGGSFDDLLTWWRRNKPAEHEKLMAGASPAN